MKKKKKRNENIIILHFHINDINKINDLKFMIRSIHSVIVKYKVSNGDIRE